MSWPPRAEADTDTRVPETAWPTRAGWFCAAPAQRVGRPAARARSPSTCSRAGTRRAPASGRDDRGRAVVVKTLWHSDLPVDARSAAPARVAESGLPVSISAPTESPSNEKPEPACAPNGRPPDPHGAPLYVVGLPPGRQWPRPVLLLDARHSFSPANPSATGRVLAASWLAGLSGSHRRSAEGQQLAPCVA